MAPVDIDLSNVRIQPTLQGDLAPLFEQQSDPAANYMAAFTAPDPYDRDAYMQKWLGVLDNPEIAMWSIYCDTVLLGSVLVYRMDGEPQLSYWIGKPFWGMGIATRAVELLLAQFTERPLYASAAEDNLGSRTVLVTCGFQSLRTEIGYANARKADIAEVIYRL